MEIWNNPRCSKCGTARRILDGAGVDYTVRAYLEEPPTPEELSEVLDRLGMQPWDITRMNEPRARELDLANLPRERDRWIAVLAENPILIQRPILVAPDGRAVVGRTDDAVRSILPDAPPAEGDG